MRTYVHENSDAYSWFWRIPRWTIIRDETINTHVHTHILTHFKCLYKCLLTLPTHKWETYKETDIYHVQTKPTQIFVYHLILIAHISLDCEWRCVFALQDITVEMEGKMSSSEMEFCTQNKNVQRKWSNFLHFFADKDKKKTTIATKKVGIVESAYLVRIPHHRIKKAKKLPVQFANVTECEWNRSVGLFFFSCSKSLKFPKQSITFTVQNAEQEKRCAYRVIL